MKVSLYPEDQVMYSGLPFGLRWITLGHWVTLGYDGSTYFWDGNGFICSGIQFIYVCVFWNMIDLCLRILGYLFWIMVGLVCTYCGIHWVYLFLDGTGFMYSGIQWSQVMYSGYDGSMITYFGLLGFYEFWVMYRQIESDTGTQTHKKRGARRIRAGEDLEEIFYS